MDIFVRYQNRQWSIDPDPAKVKLGEKVTWWLSWPNSTTRLVLWTVYFGPFRELDLQTTTGIPTSTGNTDHSGVIGPFVAEDPGDYKYGISVTDAETGVDIDEDDPHLIVQP
ncbi:hypothetical protein [Rhizobium sp. BK379]|jgi:hypothetical protein|uniref:hypothetical protein n=1 Tax=Rhizobium sp. BK379 TaxID=2587059 RepID=UPI0013AF92F3|nr:hypothetical protein [Rhizobium sp. BK379]MBB3446612.1 hypothetical protein [Rhizobium sp. BK379]